MLVSRTLLHSLKCRSEGVQEGVFPIHRTVCLPLFKTQEEQARSCLVGRRSRLGHRFTNQADVKCDRGIRQENAGASGHPLKSLWVLAVFLVC